MILTAVPMVTGLFLFIASWFDFVLVGTAESQTLAGALLALGGFAAANALQGLWRLVAGWLLIAALEFGNPATFGTQNLGQTLFSSGYTSVMTRSGGLGVVDPVDMHGSTVCDKLCKVGVCDPATTDGTGAYVPGWFDLNEAISDGCE